MSYIAIHARIYIYIYIYISADPYWRSSVWCVPKGFMQTMPLNHRRRLHLTFISLLGQPVEFQDIPGIPATQPPSCWQSNWLIKGQPEAQNNMAESSLVDFIASHIYDCRWNDEAHRQQQGARGRRQRRKPINILCVHTQFWVYSRHVNDWGLCTLNC